MPATTPPTPTRPTRRRRGLSRNALAVYGTTAALFVTTFGFLGLRVASGHDPALTAQVTQAAKTTTANTATSSANTATTTTASVQSAPVQTSTS